MQDQLEIALILVLISFVLIASAVFTLLKHGAGPRPKIQTGGTPRTPRGTFTARVARVIDGDTVDVTTAGRRIRVRLDSIDCPEDGQPWGDIAKYGLIKLIGGKTVYLEIHGEDHHDRTLATVYLSQDRGPKWINVNEGMVALGHAWVMRQFYNHLPQHRRVSLNRIEAWAKLKKVGLWKSANPIPPSKWRRTNSNSFRRN